MICGHLLAAVTIQEIAINLKNHVANVLSWEAKKKLIFPDGLGNAKQSYGKILI
jgi:hypothetical protein